MTLQPGQYQTPSGATVDATGNLIAPPPSTQTTQPTQQTTPTTEQPQETSSAPTPPSFQESLAPGAKGQDVSALQSYLVQMGYLTPDQVAGGQGIYGPKTTAAVAKLQQDLGVEAGTGAGYYGPQTKAALAQKYNQIFQNVKGKTSPDQSSAASAQIAAASQTSTDPVFGAMASAMAPILSSLTQVMNNINNPMLTAVSLQQEYNEMATKAGVPQMQAELLNWQNVMNGSEDDIRSEITKAGGTATDSQVLALTASRNKVILKQYNAVSTQYTAATENIKNMMQYATSDQATQLQRQQMTASVAESIASIESQMMTMGMTMQQHTTDNLNKIVSNVGYSGLAAQAKGDKNMLSSYEYYLGLDHGTLSDPQRLHQLETFRQQQLAQGQQKINISVGAGGGSTGIPSNATDAQVQYYMTTGTVPSFGYGTAGQQARNAFWNAVASQGGNVIGDAASNKAALSAATSALRNQTTQLAATKTSLGTLDSQLDLLTQYSDKVDRSGSPVLNKYLLYLKGQVQGDPDTQALQNIVITASNEFARILAGSSASIAGTTVSSAAEAKNLLNASMTPQQLTAVISAMKQEGQFRLDSQQETITQTTQDIKNLGSPTGGTTYTQGTQSDSTFVENTLSGQGIKYNDVINGAEGSEIPAIDRSTGAVIYLQPTEYNSTQYIRL
jgi:hypothetical protein